jgi:hypothetical protein
MRVRERVQGLGFRVQGTKSGAEYAIFAFPEP